LSSRALLHKVNATQTASSTVGLQNNIFGLLNDIKHNFFIDMMSASSGKAALTNWQGLHKL
jgi:hypothetical protein